MKKNLKALFLLPLLFSACQKPQASETIVQEKLKIPQKFSWENELAHEPNQDWWKNFNSPTLDKLIEKALKENRDLKKSYEKGSFHIDEFTCGCTGDN